MFVIYADYWTLCRVSRGYMDTPGYMAIVLSGVLGAYIHYLWSFKNNLAYFSNIKKHTYISFILF